MQETTVHALERINNPILIILLCVLMAAVAMLWWQFTQVNKQLYDLALETVGALKDTNARLSSMDEKLEQIQNT